MFFKKKSADAKRVEIGRNDPCHCGSGKKYKKCCQAKDQEATHEVIEKQWQENVKAAAQEAEKQKKEQGTAAPKTTPHTDTTTPRRRFFSLPKFNMARRSGGS